MADVFISYKREDRARVEVLISLLHDLDVDVWFDDGIAVREDWAQRIQTELEAARAILVCWTFAAISSNWVNDEADFGLRKGILVQAKIAPCVPLDRFSGDQHADLSDWEGRLDHPQLQKLLLALEPFVGKPIARNARLRAGGQHQEMVALLRALLTERARQRQAPYTYVEAAKALKAAADAEGVQIGEFDQHTLWGALDGVAEQNRRLREPPLHGLVVSKETGLPGRGYWQKHVFLPGDGSELEKVVFQRQIQRVYTWDWSRDP
ncbi:toll/interleukin-1 receptor domain-containing protein [Terricaulis sp.]|uniref:toll/interleukin-1 receptor domain-containing protein n=1 Tax=Terricaulis sp. TaxID=2768686 RepID=UPI0037846260